MKRRLPNGKRKDVFLMVRLTKDEKRRIMRMAKERGITVSQLVKQRIFNGGEQNGKEGEAE